MIDPMIVGVVAAAFLIGALLIFLIKRGEVTRLEQSLTQFRAEAAETERTLNAELRALQERNSEKAADLARLQAELRGAEKAHAEKVTELTAVRTQIEKDLAALTTKALQANQSSFLELANEVFGKHNKETTAGLKTLLTPISTSLQEYRSSLEEIEKSRQQAYGSLSAELKNVVKTQTDVRQETSKLVNALRASPKTRGRWGEEQLKNVMELAGMSAHCDFVTEKSFTTDTGRLRPDVILRLPGGRTIVIDAKTSMSNYLDALDAEDEASRLVHLQAHAKQIRTHMQQLSGKEYHHGLTVTPDFVAMFIPGENFFAAALERDPALFDDAIKNGVLIVTPTTMIALAKAVAYGWRQESAAQNALKIADLGRDLYKRLAAMGGHIMKVGTSLETSVKTYNQMIGSLEGSVMPQARKFTELDVEGAAAELRELQLIETTAREPKRDRDLELPGLDAPQRNDAAE